MRIRLVLSVVCGVFLPAEVVLAADTPKPDLKAFHAEVQKLVLKHYPKAAVKLKDQFVSFDFKTRKFLIHEPLLTGEWQDAYEDVGPQPGGIVGSLSLTSGNYNGMAAVPQTFDKRYFTVLVMAPYSAKLDAHLYIHLKYPRVVSPEFLKDFQRLANEFDKFVTKPGK